MTTGHTISLDLPADLYERVRQIAAEHDRSVETVLLETLRVMFGTLSADTNLEREALASFSDAQLWGVVHQRLAWPSRERYRELMARAKQGDLLPDEHGELDALVDQMDRYTVLRSRALRELQQRGHDISSYFKASG
ncbi:MAG: hypothetical protein K8S97_01115 [Anaerolineae bacterium]|nr:hypothetical protein [Anaerolineae bacterium]